MNLVKLSDLFEIQSGLSINQVKIVDAQTENSICYKCPSSSYQGTFSAWIIRAGIPKKYIFGAGEIFVSTNGAGSHSYSYVSTVDFVPSNNGAGLTPKRKMTLAEKQYYALCITRNRPLFSYGRVLNKTRLESIMIPEQVPDFVNSENLPDLSTFTKALINTKITLPKFSDWKWFRYGDIFDIERGFYSKKPDDMDSGIPFVGASENNNGVTSYIATDVINPDFVRRNRITVSNNGSVGSAFYHEYDFTCSINVSILALKDRELNPSLAMFITSIIHLEKFRYSYGRVWNLARMSEARIRLPVTVGGAPDWDLMERYIKSLPFSKSLE